MGVSGTKAAWLALDTDHYASTVGDAGWGCGYRNLQMLISALLKMDTYRPVMYSGECIILKTLTFFNMIYIHRKRNEVQRLRGF